MPPALLPGEGLPLADFLAHHLEGLFVAVHNLKDAVPHLGRGSPAGQNVLGAR